MDPRCRETSRLSPQEHTSDQGYPRRQRGQEGGKLTGAGRRRDTSFGEFEQTGFDVRASVGRVRNTTAKEEDCHGGREVAGGSQQPRRHEPVFRHHHESPPPGGEHFEAAAAGGARAFGNHRVPVSSVQCDDGNGICDDDGSDQAQAKDAAVGDCDAVAAAAVGEGPIRKEASPTLDQGSRPHRGRGDEEAAGEGDRTTKSSLGGDVGVGVAPRGPQQDGAGTHVCVASIPTPRNSGHQVCTPSVEIGPKRTADGDEMSSDAKEHASAANHLPRDVCKDQGHRQQVNPTLDSKRSNSIPGTAGGARRRDCVADAAFARSDGATAAPRLLAQRCKIDRSCNTDSLGLASPAGTTPAVKDLDFVKIFDISVQQEERIRSFLSLIAGQHDDVADALPEFDFIPHDSYSLECVEISPDGQKRRLGQWGRRTARTTAPLDDVASATLDVYRIRSECGPRLGYLLDHWVTGDAILQKIDCTAIAENRSFPVSRHFGEDDDNVLNKISDLEDLQQAKSGVYFEQPAFKVPKKNEDQQAPVSRFILNCKRLNELIHESIATPEMGLPRIHEILAELTKYSHVATMDARSWFYQIPLHRNVQNLFHFKVAYRRGRFVRRRLRVLPMGLAWAPAIAQSLSQFFVDKLKAMFPSNVFITVWVDNFIFAANTEGTLHALLSAAKTLFAEYGLAVKAVDWSGNILGLQVCNKRIRLSDGFLSSTMSAVHAFYQDHTVASFLSVAGRLVYANWTIGRRPLCFFQELLQGLRLYSTKPLSSQVSDIDFSTISKDIDAMTKLLPQMEFNVHSIRPSFHNILWTDSSSSGLAAVLEDAHIDIITVLKTEPIPPKHMYLAELLAILLGSYLADAFDAKCQCLSDNTTAVAALRKGHTKSAIGNDILAEIYKSRNLTGIGWVSTDAQRADGPSRQELPGPRVNVSWEKLVLPAWKAGRS